MKEKRKMLGSRGSVFENWINATLVEENQLSQK